jgi:nucleoside-diphosphate-sugar epimerase
MKLGITGAQGFIGSNLLLFLKNVRVPYVEMDGDCFDNYLDCGITNIIHLAGRTPSSTTLSVSDYLRDNVSLSSKVLDFAVKINVPTLLFSTYGYHPSQKNPVSAYHLSKAISEHVASYYVSQFGLKIQVLRLASVYGATQRSGALLPSILEQAKGTQESIFIRNPNALRSYISVLDVIEFIMLILEKNSSPQTCFVGDHDLTSVGDFARLVLETIGCRKNVEFISDDACSETEVSLHAAIKHNIAMGNQHEWSPKRSLHQGLKEAFL